MIRTAPFRFDSKKALEVILYIAQHAPIPDRIHIAKILYLADKYHLQKYGLFICGDYYVAMEHGPVPSGVLDFLRGTKEPKERAAFNRQGYNIQPLRAPDLDYLSEADIECLDEAIDELGNVGIGELKERCHDGAWLSTATNEAITVEQIAETLPNSETILEYLRSL